MYHPISECWLFHHAPHQGFTFFFLHFILFLLSLCFLLYLCLTSLLLVLLLVFIFLLALINFFSSILLTSAFLSFLLHPLLFSFLRLKPCSHNSIGTLSLRFKLTYILSSDWRAVATVLVHNKPVHFQNYGINWKSH